MAWDHWHLAQMQAALCGDVLDLSTEASESAFNAGAVAAWQGQSLEQGFGRVGPGARRLENIVDEPSGVRLPAVEGWSIWQLVFPGLVAHAERV